MRVSSKKFRQVILAPGTGIDPNQTPERLELYDAQGNPVNLGGGGGGSGSAITVFDATKEYTAPAVVFFDRALWLLLEGTTDPPNDTPGEAGGGGGAGYVMNTPDHPVTVDTATLLPSTINLVDNPRTAYVQDPGGGTEAIPFDNSTLLAFDVVTNGTLNIAGLVHEEEHMDYCLLLSETGAIIGALNSTSYELVAGVKYFLLLASSYGNNIVQLTATQGLTVKDSSDPGDGPTWVKLSELNPL